MEGYSNSENHNSINVIILIYGFQVYEIKFRNCYLGHANHLQDIVLKSLKQIISSAKEKIQHQFKNASRATEHEFNISQYQNVSDKHGQKSKYDSYLWTSICNNWFMSNSSRRNILSNGSMFFPKLASLT